MVSDTGIVKSSWRGGRILKVSYDGDRYPQVKLYNNGFGRSLKVHKVVSMAFMIRPSKDAHIDHIDCNKTNNRLSNLEWVTQAENCKRAKEKGLLNAPKGIRAWNSKFTELDIVIIREACKFFSTYKVAKYFGVTQGAVSHVVNRRNWRHIP